MLAADWVNEIRLELGRLSPPSAEALIRHTGLAEQASVPSRAVPRWLDLSSTVVKLSAPSGRLATQP